MLQKTSSTFLKEFWQHLTQRWKYELTQKDRTEKKTCFFYNCGVPFSHIERERERSYVVCTTVGKNDGYTSKTCLSLTHSEHHKHKKLTQ